MTTVQEVIKAAIPDADKETCEYILWERTCYPFGKLTARDIFKAASRTHRASENGIVLCDLCDTRVAKGEYVCERCREGLDSANS